MNYLLLINLLVLIIPSTSSSSSFPIEITATQHRKYFPHQISTFTQYVNIEIQTGENTNEQSSPAQELFLILDTSGSMAGESKLAHAKQAIESIIHNMNPKDRLHLIQYNSYSSIVFEDQNNQELMLDKLRSLSASGGTNLMAGFEETKSLLRKYSKRSSVKRLFIFSDGQINEGVTVHDQLLNEVSTIKNKFELTICSFGIGLDFDEKLMTNIADYGSGDYFFIRGGDNMRKVVDIAYKGFQKVMGVNAYLKITTKNDAHIVDVYGYEDSKEGDNEIVPIGDIRYNDRMNVLLETEIKITEKLLEKSQIDYMIVELWMTDVNDQQSKLIATESIVFSLSKNEEELKDINKLVEYLVQLQNIQKDEEQVTQLLREKRTVEAHQMKTRLSDRIRMSSSNLERERAESDESMITLQNVYHQAKIMEHRAEVMETLFTDDGMTSEELALQNQYHAKLNKKFRDSQDEL